MTDLIIISSSIVRPGNINEPGRIKIHLTPFDLHLLYAGYSQRGLLFNKKPVPDTYFVSRLKTPLSTVLDIYFPFSGHLVRVDNLEDKTVLFYIDCDGRSGAKFVHAESKSLSVSDMLEPHGSVPNFMSSFFPSFGVKSIDGITEPLLALQVTEMKDGVFIGFGYNHMVAHGASIWKFINTWSKICYGGLDHHKHNLSPLVLKGWFLDGINYPIHVPALELVPCDPRKEISSLLTTKERVFHFTKRNLSCLKAKANREIGSGDLTISSLQALSAHLWRSVMRHSGMSQEDETHCKVAVDLRQRLHPLLEKECFGNMSSLGVATVTVKELMDHEMGWAALQVNKMVKSLTDEKFKTSAKNWVQNVRMPKTFGGSSMVCDYVLVTSSPRFDVYGNDFGWGKPIAAKPARSTIKGNLVLFQGVEEGSVDVHATLWSHVLVNLLDDIEFLEYVTNT